MRNTGQPDGLDRAMTMRDFMRAATMDAGLVGSPRVGNNRLDQFYARLDRDIAHQAFPFPSLLAAPSEQGQGASVVVPTADARASIRGAR